MPSARRGVPFGNWTRAATQSLTTGTSTAIVMDTVGQDRYGMLGSPLSRIVVPRGWGGQFNVSANVAIAPNTDTARRYLSFRVNSVATDLWLQEVAAINSASIDTWLVSAGGLYLNVGDYVEVFVRQDSAATLTADFTRLSMNWVSG